MARPREFDIDKAVTDAMGVFWAYGYEDSALPQLLEGMGLSRGSLYKAFEGKQPLFIAALDRYAQQEVAPIGKTLMDDTAGDGLTRIATVFESIPDILRNGDDRGCLLCSAAAGRAAHEPEIATVIAALLKQIEHAFAVALAASGHTSAGMAHMLVAHYIGLKVLVRANTPLNALESNVAALLDLLAQARPT